jgi:hypothetical protein
MNHGPQVFHPTMQTHARQKETHAYDGYGTHLLPSTANNFSEGNVSCMAHGLSASTHDDVIRFQPRDNYDLFFRLFLACFSLVQAAHLPFYFKSIGVLNLKYQPKQCRDRDFIWYDE